jgi:hypothetical protein
VDYWLGKSRSFEARAGWLKALVKKLIGETLMHGRELEHHPMVVTWSTNGLKWSLWFLSKAGRGGRGETPGTSQQRAIQTKLANFGRRALIRLQEEQIKVQTDPRTQNRSG